MDGNNVLTTNINCEREPMPAFMIILCKIHDREKFLAGYTQVVRKILEQFGGEYIVAAPGAELLEGTLEGYTSVALSKWPSKAAAKAFWNSPEYAEAKKLREGLADAEVLIVEAP